jgi:hypothetical protein
VLRYDSHRLQQGQGHNNAVRATVRGDEGMRTTHTRTQHHPLWAVTEAHPPSPPWPSHALLMCQTQEIVNILGTEVNRIISKPSGRPEELK